MPTITGGGASAITGAEIVDGSISNADVSPTAVIALTKIAGLIGKPGDFISVDTDTTGTKSVTTLANQRLIVFACATIQGGTGTMTSTLSYNGVQKATQGVRTGNSGFPSGVFLNYSEVPGAGTHDIVLAGDQSLANIYMIIIKLQESA